MVNGRKRHLLLDTTGLVMKAKAHPADLSNREGALAAAGAGGRGLFPAPRAPVGGHRLPRGGPAGVDHRAARALAGDRAAQEQVGVGPQRRVVRAHPGGL